MASAWMSERVKKAIRAGFGMVLLADDADDLVEVEVDGEVAVEDLEAAFDGGQAVAGAAFEDDQAVIEPGADDGAEAEHHGGVIDGQHVHVQGETRFELGGAEQCFHEHFGLDGAGLGFEYEADGLGALVADIAEEGQLLQFEQLGDLFDQPRFLHLIGDFGDDDLPHAELAALNFPAGAGAEAAAAGLVGVEHRLGAFDQDASGWEVGALDVHEQVCSGRGRVVDQVDGGGADFAGVVRRDARGHADRDAGGAVGEQVGEAAGEDEGLALLAIVGGAEIDGVVVDAG